MPESDMKYAFILDAGSSGTRLFVYQWSVGNPLSTLSCPASYKNEQKPGISKTVQGSEAVYGQLLEQEADARAHGGDASKAQAASKAASDVKATLQSEVDNHLQPLFEKAQEFANIQELDPAIIPLFVLGTAGIRDLRTDSAVLPESARIGNRQYDDLLFCMMQSCRKTEFKLEECGAISGEAEALYGWITANYIKYSSSSSPSDWPSETFGYAEMGGASAQIVFEPYRADVDRAYDGVFWKVSLGDRDFELFLGSYPLGMNKGVKLYFARLITEHLEGDSSNEMVVIDPGKPSGLEKQFESWTLRGPSYDEEPISTSPISTHGRSAKNTSVHPSILPAIDTPRFRFSPEYRLVLDNLRATIASAMKSDGARLPKLRPSKAAIKAHEFLGGANFWYSTRTLFGVDSDGKPKTTDFSFAEFRVEVTRTLAVPWDKMKEKLPYANPDYLEDAWIKAMWTNEVLTRQFGLDNDGNPTQAPMLTFKPYNGSDGKELTWTLGRLVHFITGNRAPVRERGGLVQFRPFLDTRV